MAQYDPWKDYKEAEYNKFMDYSNKVDKNKADIYAAQNASQEKVATMHYGPGGAMDREIAALAPGRAAQTLGFEQDTKKKVAMLPFDIQESQGNIGFQGARTTALNQANEQSQYTWDTTGRLGLDEQRKYLPQLTSNMARTKLAEGTVLSDPEEWRRIFRSQTGGSFNNPSPVAIPNVAVSTAVAPTAPNYSHVFDPTDPRKRLGVARP
jgi:hypothetical protein